MALPKKGRKFDNDADRREEFEQKILDLARVTRVTAGGKRMRFRCCLVIGDKKGRVGFAVAKGADVQLAIQKSFTKAKKNVMVIPLVNETIPHDVRFKYGSVKLLLKPARRGTGIKAGGALRSVLELGGVPNVVGKSLGCKNKINNVKATFMALKLLRRYAPVAEARAKEMEKRLEEKKGLVKPALEAQTVQNQENKPAAPKTPRASKKTAPEVKK
ncbi:MAG: 30S ribosomal protein S5 [bacterium]